MMSKHIYLIVLLPFFILIVSCKKDCINCSDCGFNENKSAVMKKKKFCRNDFDSDSEWQEFKNNANKFCDCE